jgi:hypothetical protein
MQHLHSIPVSIILSCRESQRFIQLCCQRQHESLPEMLCMRKGLKCNEQIMWWVFWLLRPSLSKFENK